MQKFSPRSDPEVAMGAVGASALERPLRQISPSVPSETVTDHDESAASGSFDMRQMFEALMRKMDVNARDVQGMASKMDANAQRMDAKMEANARDMQALGGDM